MKIQTFNDGVLTVYSVENISPKGNMPKDGLILNAKGLRYEERVVGVNRYFVALQVSKKIQQVLRVPRIANIETDYVVIPNDGKQYRVVQIQHRPEVQPPCMDLSLERVGDPYDIETI